MRRIRTSILEQRKDPRLVDKLYARKDRVHARLLPGYDAKGWWVQGRLLTLRQQFRDLRC